MTYEKKSDKLKKNRLAKVPIILQLEALECGAACLAMILAYYNKWVPIEKLRVECGVSRDGSNAKNILMVAKKYGMNVQAYKFEPNVLKEKGKFPCIIHWKFNHFVVLNTNLRNIFTCQKQALPVWKNLIIHLPVYV